LGHGGDDGFDEAHLLWRQSDGGVHRHQLEAALAANRRMVDTWMEALPLTQSP
jgi:hypothetical protein